MASAFRRLPIAVVMIDGDRNLRPFNARATELFEREGLMSGLLAQRPSHPLSVMIKGLLDSRDEPMKGTHVTFPSGSVYAIEPSERSSKGRDRWLVLLIEPAIGDPNAPQQFDLTRWGFTPREEDIVRLLLAGESTHSITEKLGISENTVRTHLKKVFDKTAARSRTELMAKVLRR